MSKHIKLTLENGEIYAVPLLFIAINRANNYESPLSLEHDQEIAYVMNDPYEGVDWLQNNMNWEDIESELIKIEAPAPDYNYLFRNADVSIIEKE